LRGFERNGDVSPTVHSLLGLERGNVNKMEMKHTKIEEGAAVLDRIIGARLTSVQFVLDYLILGFDGKGAFTSLVWPEISIGGSVLNFGMQCYRDRLCDLIPQVVSEVHVAEDETITISFGDNRLRIPLQQRQLPGERAIFTAPKHFLYVW
jgi:hypothetical protein